MLYHHRRKNDHPVFKLIKKKDTYEFLAEGQVKLVDNEISNNDIFPTTIIFNTNSFKFVNGYFGIGICDSKNYYRNIYICQTHRTISDKMSGELKMGFDLPQIKMTDILSITTDYYNMFLTINGEKHNVWDISQYKIDEWKIYCYMSNGKIIYIN